MADHALVAEVEEGPDRPARTHRLLERGVGVFGVVEEDERQVVHAEPSAAALDRAADLRAVEGEGRMVAIRLRADEDAGRHAASLGEDDADPPLTLAVTVDRGRVDEPDRAVEDRPDGRQRPVLGDLEGEDVGHRAEWGGPEPERSDGQPGGADGPAQAEVDRRAGRPVGLGHRQATTAASARQTAPSGKRWAALDSAFISAEKPGIDGAM